MHTLLTPENGAILDLCTSAQRAFAKNSRDYAVPSFDWRNLVETTEADCTFPNPVHFSWDGIGNAVLQITDTEDFTHLVRTVLCIEPFVDVYNLEIGRTYYWRVVWEDETSITQSFSTRPDAPRWLWINGLTNVRDMGGWIGKDGRRMRQGLLYRGSEMDIHKTITDAGITEMRDYLGVRTDLDVRGEVVGKRFDSPLGTDIQYSLIPIAAYDEFFRDTTPYPLIFSLLAERDRYPIYFHCWGGADRTGSLACLIEALCGVSAHDQDLDYELTSLSVWGQRSSQGEGWVAFQNALIAYGETRTEQVRAFLRHAGVSDETMDRVIDILLED